MFRTKGPTKNKEWSGGTGNGSSEVVDIYKKTINDNGYKLYQSINRSVINMDPKN